MSMAFTCRAGRPRRHGRAGRGPEFDPATLAAKLAANLPAYARPIFLRLQPEMEITGTFKQRKVELVKDGFDPQTIADPLYCARSDDERYERLDKEGYEAITSGRVKL